MNYSYIKKVYEELKKIDKDYARGLINEQELVQSKKRVLEGNSTKKADLESLESLKSRNLITNDEYNQIKERIEVYEYLDNENVKFASEKEVYVKRLEALYELGLLTDDELTKGLQDIENKYK